MGAQECLVGRAEKLDKFTALLEAEYNPPESVGSLPPPQPGPQTAFLESKADITFYGGAAGGGKTAALLLDFARPELVQLPGYGGVIFRRTYAQVKNEGGLWDEATKFYPDIGGEPKESVLEYQFPPGSTVRFAHLQHEKNKLDWQGAQLARLGFDELTHFSETQIFYMLSRARTTIGIRPQVRGTTNPDADSWLVTGPDGWGSGFMSWWIDDDGFAIPERSGVVRWFVRIQREIHWASDPSDLKLQFPGVPPKSFTFIASKLSDNRILMEADPSYLANLMALHPTERARLLEGNWKVRDEAGKFINRGWFPILDQVPIQGGLECRFWDLAATAKETRGDDPDWTVGWKMRKVGHEFFVSDVLRLRGNPAEVERTVLNTAAADGRGCLIGFEQEPGSAGKQQIHEWRQKLTGYPVRSLVPHGDKLERARPFAVQSEAGNIKMLRAPWNNAVLSVLHSVPDGAHDDDLDAGSGCYQVLMGAGASGGSGSSVAGYG